MMLVVGSDESLNRRGFRVVTHQAGNQIEKNGLSVCTCAVEKEQRVLIGDTGQDVPAHALNEPLQFELATRDAVEEHKPKRALAARCRSCDLRAVVLPFGIAENAGPQIN